MSFRKRLDDRNTMMTIGMTCLLLATLSHWFVAPATLAGQRLADGGFGLLTGISIGSNLLSLRYRRCSRGEA